MEEKHESELLKFVEVLTPEILLEKRRVSLRLQRQILFLEQCMEKLKAEFDSGFPVKVHFDGSSRILSSEEVDEVLASLAQRGWKARYVPGYWDHLSISPA